MAVLADADRATVHAGFMSDLSSDRDPVAGLTKTQLRAAVDALDAWLDTNAAAVNAAIPQPARSALTASQKARLLAYVIRQRYVKGA